ncbi:MAG: AAA family ATPase [Pseudomonadota bacterium]
MYENFYGLKTRPFQVVPDPAFMYWSEAHLMTFTMLRYGILSASPLTVITGDVGAGKTTLLRQLLEEFPDDLVAGLVSNIQSGKGELLEWALMAFEQPYHGLSHVERYDKFQRFVVETYASGKQVTLIVDEAQNLGVEQLEELRMLSNINAEKDQLLQIILVGQPELRELLARPELRQFSQRISSDFHLGSLTADEVYKYIERRLAVAGAEWEVFPQPTCDLIYHATQGVPRLINVLCDLCLVYGFSGDRQVIDEDILRELMSSMERNGIFNQFTPLGATPKLVDTGGPHPEPGAQTQIRRPKISEQALDAMDDIQGDGYDDTPLRGRT